MLKSHVSAGIDIAYKSGLPKALIAFIPQHHGTAVMSYFYARAREQAAAPTAGSRPPRAARRPTAVDIRKFRHGGPKPQTREAAIIMLADSVEASVRSLSSRDEPAIRAMVARIFEERISDDQFGECDLTLRDIERIREAFVEQLLGCTTSGWRTPRTRSWSWSRGGPRAGRSRGTLDGPRRPGGSTPIAAGMRAPAASRRSRHRVRRLRAGGVRRHACSPARHAQSVRCHARLDRLQPSPAPETLVQS